MGDGLWRITHRLEVRALMERRLNNGGIGVFYHHNGGRLGSLGLSNNRAWSWRREGPTMAEMGYDHEYGEWRGTSIFSLDLDYNGN